MLVLSRKVGEKLVIDGGIVVEVMRIQGNRITVGITAPSDIRILRGELSQADFNSDRNTLSQNRVQESYTEYELLETC